MFQVRKVVSYLNKNDGKTTHRQNLDDLGLRFRLFYETWLCEPFWDTLFKRSPFKEYGSIYKTPQTNWGKKCEVKRFKEIEDLINKAIQIGFIKPQGFSNYLVVTQKGREFLRPMQIYFIEYTAQEFRYTSTITASILATAVISVVGTLLVVLW